MKIGILTFHRAINYGAVLQCYALTKVLEKMGFAVEIIDYRPPYIEKYRKLFYWKDFKKKGIIAKFRNILFLPVEFLFKRKTSKVFDQFINDNFKISKQIIDCSDIPSYYDVIMFGSDQIWSPQICEGFDNVYWGQFSKGNCKFITYAASLGGHNHLSEDDWKEIKKLINVYDYISVREKALYDDLMEHTIKVPSLVIDPTLLAPISIFDKIAKKPEEKDYVLLFTLEHTKDEYAFAKRIANEKRYQLIRICAIRGVVNRESLTLKSAISPNEFLGYIKYAAFVVTVSFHGTAFSVIFNKDFYTLRSQQEDRSYNLLKSVGLEDRLVDPKQVEIITRINHTNTNERINQLRKESEDFLLKSLM